MKKPKTLLSKYPCICTECEGIRDALRSVAGDNPKIEKLTHAQLDSMVVARGRSPKVSN